MDIRRIGTCRYVQRDDGASLGEPDLLFRSTQDYVIEVGGRVHGTTCCLLQPLFHLRNVLVSNPFESLSRPCLGVFSHSVEKPTTIRVRKGAQGLCGGLDSRKLSLVFHIPAFWDSSEYFEIGGGQVKQSLLEWAVRVHRSIPFEEGACCFPMP